MSRLPDAISATNEPRSRAGSSLVQLTLVRYREFLREPEAVFWTFVFPILLAAGLGVAFRSQPAAIMRVGVPRETAGAEELARAVRSDPRLTVDLVDGNAALRRLRSGRILVIAEPDGRGGVVYHYDDTNPEARTARLMVDDAVQRAAGRPNPVPVRTVPVNEPGSRYIDFLIPGLLGMNLMGSGMWGVGFPIVDARRKKLLKRLVAAPMSRAEYLLSFLLSRLTFLLLEVMAVVGFGYWVFGVPVRGSLGMLALISLLSSLAFAAMGLLVASRVQTIEAVSGLMNFVMLPMWIFSGVFFSAERFPEVIQPFVQALPLTAAVDALRARMLEGSPPAELAGELGIVAVWLAASFVLALKIFRWR
ncbi:MAG: ABC transporter permease [Bryobacterales bacterium]|nr:ABC transporter permease [Bryobacterales bacterium]